MRALILASIAAFCLASPGLARPPETLRLRHQLSVDPNDQAMIARLADIYVREGRTVRAARLYRGLMNLDNVELVRADGARVWSHSIAREALEAPQAKPIRFTARD